MNMIESPRNFATVSSSHYIVGVHIESKKRVIITEPKTIYFDLSKVVDNNLKYETEFILKTQRTFS